MITYFCPQCWTTLSADAVQCPSCGKDLRAYANLPYEDKLILALDHPVQQTRLMAVWILGRLHSQAALPKFQDMLEHEQDYYLLREVILALAAINTPQSKQLLEQAAAHPSRLVAACAQRTLATLESGKR